MDAGASYHSCSLIENFITKRGIQHEQRNFYESLTGAGIQG